MMFLLGVVAAVVAVATLIDCLYTQRLHSSTRVVLALGCLIVALPIVAHELLVLTQ